MKLLTAFIIINLTCSISHAAYSKKKLISKIKSTNSKISQSKDFKSAYQHFLKLKKAVYKMKSKPNKDFTYLQGLKFVLDDITTKNLKTKSACQGVRTQIILDNNPHARSVKETPTHAQHGIKLLDSLCRKL